MFVAREVSGKHTFMKSMSSHDSPCLVVRQDIHKLFSQMNPYQAWMTSEKQKLFTRGSFPLQYTFC